MRHRFSLVIVAIGLCLAVPLSCHARDDADPTFLVLLGGRLIDGTGAEPVDDALVIVSGDRILYAGASSEVEIPTRATILDTAGLTILPGFINAHVHRGAQNNNLRAWVWEGVTTVRDLGTDRVVLESLRETYPPIPERARLVAAGPLITVPGGYPIVPFGGGPTATVHSVENARLVGEILLDSPAIDMLKLALETGTVFGRGIPAMSRAEASMLVRVAHGRGTVASAHITSVVDLDLALDAGADDLAHMAVDRLLTDAETQRVVAQGVYWVPTLELWQCTGSVAMARQNLQRFVAAGGSVALGTDFEGYSCNWELGMPMTEIGLMRQAGMTAMEIIVSATRNGARVCGLERELGTLERGKIADVIAIAGDPLLDLDALAEIRLVVHDGVPIRCQVALVQKRGPRQAAGRPQ